MKSSRKLLALSLMLVLVVTAAFAVTTPLTVQTLKINNYAVQAGDLTMTLAAADNTNGNSFAATGQEIVIAQNTDASAHTITVTSVADVLGRTDSSLTSYSVAANTFVAIQMRSTTGWLQTTGVINVSANSNLVKFAVVRYTP